MVLAWILSDDPFSIIYYYYFSNNLSPSFQVSFHSPIPAFPNSSTEVLSPTQYSVRVRGVKTNVKTTGEMNPESDRERERGNPKENKTLVESQNNTTQQQRMVEKRISTISRGAAAAAAAVYMEAR